MEQHPQALEQEGIGQELPDRSRRSFLKAAPLGALAVVASTADAAETPAAAPQVKRGYHETEHIRRYYETAAYW